MTTRVAAIATGSERRVLANVTGVAAPIDYLERDAPPLFEHVVRAMLDTAVEPGAVERPAVDVPDSAWGVVFATLCRHRIETLLPPVLDAGRLRVPSPARDRIAARARLAAVERLRLTAALREVIALFATESLEVRVLKGLATGRLDHRQPAWRRTSDVDLLVRRDHFDRACDLVAATGATDVKPDEPAALLVERTFRRSDGVAVDVHHRLFRFGRDDTAALFDRPEPLGDGEGLAMPREARLVHAAAHLLVSPPGRRQLSSLVDVAVLAASADRDAARELGDRLGVGDIVTFAVWLAENVGVADPAPEPPSRSTLINRACLRTDRRVDLETLAVCRDLTGVRDRLAYLRFQLGRHARRRHGRRRRR